MAHKINQHHRKTRVIAVAALIAGVIGLGVAFAALSTSLLINGTATIQSASWSVQWKSSSPAPACTATGEATFASPTISQTTSVNDTITISPSFKTNGDTVVCTFTAANLGTLNAKLGTIAPNIGNLTTNNITPTLTYGNGNVPASGDILAANSTQEYKLLFEYTGGTVQQEVDNLTYVFTIPYEQANQ
jgi:hypothetical protein